MSAVVRELIDRAYDDAVQAQRCRAAREIADLEIEAMPIPMI